ncbi:hypothetical protein VNI00_004361 [Paramarasmius palmivorus]|uniref:Uncharacterized protein n=1 Tax=Paramarasmius palmivorus TaxID=297713 RepID=A0AAW0DMG2_9AGAR
MAPSALYSKLFSLAQAHAEPKDLDQILNIRSRDAIHAWGHNYLVSKNPGLADRMDNDAFEAHLINSGRYLDMGSSQVHDIIVDEHKRRAVIHMSYFLKPKDSKEMVEHDLIWTLKFTDEDKEDEILIKESVEFIDAAAGARVGAIVQEIHGEIDELTRGSITLKGI